MPAYGLSRHGDGLYQVSVDRNLHLRLLNSAGLPGPVLGQCWPENKTLIKYNVHIMRGQATAWNNFPVLPPNSRVRVRECGCGSFRTWSGISRAQSKSLGRLRELADPSWDSRDSSKSSKAVSGSSPDKYYVWPDSGQTPPHPSHGHILPDLTHTTTEHGHAFFFREANRIYQMNTSPSLSSPKHASRVSFLH